LTGTLSLLLQKNQLFVINQFPALSQIKANLIQIVNWWLDYATWPVVLLMLAGFIFSWRKFRPSFFLLSLFIFPVLVFESLFSRILFPRYFLFSQIFALLWAAVALDALSQKLSPALRVIFSVLIFLPSFSLQFRIINDLKTAPLPAIERWQYVTGWPSGYGLKQFTAQVKNAQPDILVVEINELIKSGLPYLWPDHSLKLIIMTPDNQLSPADQRYLAAALKTGKKIFLGLNILEASPDMFIADKIVTVFRPENQSSLRLYQITGLNSYE
jgi:hypothetical protein